MLDEENPLTQRFLALQNATLEACEAFPDQAESLNALCLQIGGLLSEEAGQLAETKIDELEALLEKCRPGETAGPTTSTIPTPPPPPPDAAAARFATRLKALQPRIVAAIAAATSASEEIKLRNSEMGVFGRKKEFAEAGRLLDTIEQLLDQETPPVPPPQPPPRPVSPVQAQGEEGTTATGRLAEGARHGFAKR